MRVRLDVATPKPGALLKRWGKTLAPTCRYHLSRAVQMCVNLVDGLIRTSDGGLLRATDNFDTSASCLYLGVHPVRNLYVNAAAMVFTWSGKPPRRDVTDTAVPDLCGVPRSPHPTYGAFEDLSACLITK
jgi:hypothetical protein